MEKTNSSKIVRLFPYLHDIKPFIIKNHPTLHPDTNDYIEYWEEQEKRCIEGFWGLDKNKETNEGGWRFCPPQLYYYVNFCVIEDEDEEANSTKVINPMLRDIEWIFFYNWLICRGFSGYEGDKNFTCNSLIKKLESGELLSTKDKLRLQLAKHIHKEDGTYKKYVEPREYLYKTQSEPLGRPLYGNVAKNMMALTSRRQGKSFWLMGLISHTFNFHGAIRFDSTYFNMEKGPEIVVGSVLGKSADMLKKFLFNQEYQKNNYGAWGENDAFTPGWFYLNTQGSLTISNSKSPYRNEFDYVEGGIWKKGGKGTKIIHVTYQDNPEASVGTGPIMSVIEEIGLVSNLLDVHKCYAEGTKVRMYNTTLKNVEDVQIGDLIMGNDGNVRTVKNIYSGIDQLYTIKQRGSISYTVNSKHDVVYYQRINYPSDGYKINTAEDIYNFSKTRKKGLYGLKSNIIPFSKKELLLDPYYLGLFIGDGIARDGAIVANINENTINMIRWIKNYFKSLNLSTTISGCKKTPTFYPSINNTNSKKNYIKRYLKHYNILNKKEIPEDYLKSSEKDRLELLAGIIDTDGTYCNRKSGRNFVIYVGGREKLVDQIKFLSNSLGFKTSSCNVIRNKKHHLLGTHITISGDIHKIPTKTKHKQAEINSHQCSYMQGLKIEKSNIGKYYGFELEENPYFLGEDNTILSNSNETTFIRKNKTGSALYVGTAGNIEKIIEPKIIFEDPTTYDMLEFPDLWENRKKPIGFFLPAYYTDNSFRDVNGNQDIEAAYEEEMHQRKIRAGADNSLALDGWMMSRPLVPSEMFLSSTANVFPTALLRDRLTEVEVKKIFEVVSFKGTLEWVKNKTSVLFKPDINNKLRPILSTNLDQYKGNIKGAIVCYEYPENDIPNPTKRSSLYKVVYDPIKDDGEGTSLASIIVYKGVSDNWATGVVDDIVCEYIGRTDLVEEIHDIALKIATFYNAKIMVETNIPDFIRYCRRENKLNMLAGKPIEAISKAVKNPGKKYDVGIDMSSSQLHTHAEQLIRQWLLSPWKTNSDGIQLLNLHKLKSPRILLELIQYERKINSDHVSSLKLLMLWLSQDKQIPVEKASDKAKETMNSFFKAIKLTKITNPYYTY